METTPTIEYHLEVARIFGTNSVLVVEGGKVVVVDAGAGVSDLVLRTVAAHGWEPLAVLISHGHVDHTWDAAALSDGLDVPVLVSGADRYQFEDPFGLDPRHPERADPAGMLVSVFATYGLTPDQFRMPARLWALGSPEAAETEAMIRETWSAWRPIASPGHTPGATVYIFGSDGLRPLACTGDVLFRSSVGRTDLPGGNDEQMRSTLAKLVHEIPRDAVVVPGHGPVTTMGQEIVSNPYLRYV